MFTRFATNPAVCSDPRTISYSVATYARWLPYGKSSPKDDDGNRQLCAATIVYTVAELIADRRTQSVLGATTVRASSSKKFQLLVLLYISRTHGATTFDLILRPRYIHMHRVELSKNQSACLYSTFIMPPRAPVLLLPSQQCTINIYQPVPKYKVIWYYSVCGVCRAGQRCF